jgi:hypothetical protein
MTDATRSPAGAPDHPYRAEIDIEHACWTEIAGLCRGLTPEERLRPGYFHDPDWSVKDLVGHLGAWMADAELHLLRIEAGTERDEPIDVDALNAAYLAALRDQDWPTVWTQAISARTQMLGVWARLESRTETADYWVRKAGAMHDGEHLPRLRSWVEEMRRG